MGPISDKSGGAASVPKPNDWILARMQRNGFPLNVRMANAYRGLGGVPGYDHKVIVVIPLNNPAPSGLPYDNEFDDLKATELAICGQLEVDNESLCVLAITGCGTRDLIFYTRDPESTQMKINAAQTIVTSHKFDTAIQPDLNWELFGAFDKAIASSTAKEIKPQSPA